MKNILFRSALIFDGESEVDGNPLEDISLFGDQARGISIIMKAGRFEKRQKPQETSGIPDIAM
jgi:hypothetical protein